MEVFLELLSSEEIEKVSADADQADTLLHLLDAVVIKLEGGTEEDLQVLNIKPFKAIIAKDVLKEKEENKSKPSIEKKSENRYFMTLYMQRNQIVNIFYNYFCTLLYFSDENKTGEHSEKSSKNDETATEVESSEKDENAIPDSDKVKQNDDEGKDDVEEAANEDKPRM